MVTLEIYLANDSSSLLGSVGTRQPFKERVLLLRSTMPWWASGLLCQKPHWKLQPIPLWWYIMPVLQNSISENFNDKRCYSGIIQLYNLVAGNGRQHWKPNEESDIVFTRKRLCFKRFEFTSKTALQNWKTWNVVPNAMINKVNWECNFCNPKDFTKW